MIATHSAKESTDVQEEKPCPAFKARVALAALSGEKTVAELSAEFGIHQTPTHKWVKQLKESAADIFSGEIKIEEAKKEKQLQVLHAKTGKLTVERDFLADALRESGIQYVIQERAGRPS